MRRFSNFPLLIMKKIIWLPVLIVVLVVAWLGTSWYGGKRVEDKLNEQIGLMNEMWAASGGPKERIQIKQISYERGLLSTHARYALTIGALPSDQSPEIDLTVRHGPFPGGLTPRKFALHAELVSAGILKTVSDTAMGGKPPLAIDAACAYGGHCTGTGNIPAVNFAPAPQFKLAFGGVRMQFDGEWHSETDHQTNASAQILPLTINDQDFGSGQWTVTGNAQGFDETVIWKTDKGESKLALAMTTARPVTSAELKAVKPEEILGFVGGLLKTASVKLALSKPMLVDMGARGIHLAMGMELDAAQEQVSQGLEEALAHDPRTKEFIQVQGDAIISDWQYADGKLTVNGQDKPEVLAELMQAFKMGMEQAQRRQTAPDEK